MERGSVGSFPQANVRPPAGYAPDAFDEAGGGKLGRPLRFGHD